MKSKKSSRKKRFSVILMAAGLTLSAAGLGLLGYNIWENKQAEQSVKHVREELIRSISEENDVKPPVENESEILVETEEELPDPNRPMPTIEVEGYRYIGMLEIPSLEIELPVMEEWDYDRMKIAPCRYAGSLYTGDLIIAGHNYAAHLGSLQNLQAGETVSFTDAENNVYSYTVVRTELINGTAVEEMEAGEWDLTIFTCTYGGQARVTVRCIA